MIYSRIGWGGGKLAYLLGCSVTHPYDNENLDHAWTKNKKRKLTLPRNINLGCRRKYLPPEDKTCLNYNSENAADKIFTFKAFDEFNIPHPKVFTEKQIIGMGREIPTYFLGRLNKSHSGKGIVKYSRKGFRETRAKGGFKGHDFYTEFLSFKEEYRIHVFMGNAFCFLKKEVKPDSGFIHTLDKGCPLILGPLDHAQSNKMQEMAICAILAVGLQFGAVDLFVDQNDKIYVLEVNSDPGIPGIIGFLYAEQIRKYFNLDAPDYYYPNYKGGITEIDEKYFYYPPDYKRKKIKAKDEDFSYQNEGVKMVK